MEIGKTWYSGEGATSPMGFFFFFFFYKQVLFWIVVGEGFHDSQDLGSQGILSSLRTFTNEAERTLDLPRRRIRQGTSPWLSTQ